jgi:hypothetical protein
LEAEQGTGADALVDSLAAYVKEFGDPPGVPAVSDIGAPDEEGYVVAGRPAP